MKLDFGSQTKQNGSYNAIGDFTFALVTGQMGYQTTLDTCVFTLRVCQSNQCAFITIL